MLLVSVEDSFSCPLLCWAFPFLSLYRTPSLPLSVLTSRHRRVLLPLRLFLSPPSLPPSSSPPGILNIGRSIENPYAWETFGTRPFLPPSLLPSSSLPPSLPPIPPLSLLSSPRHRFRRLRHPAGPRLEFDRHRLARRPSRLPEGVGAIPPRPRGRAPRLTRPVSSGYHGGG
ncbi:hypothetical protein Naga_102185g1 [Nannochloropsis gaditana]|uniref:Uncharacterized protein n=1 Tax=Nannochloropsis gaditana TaxID=72520 RepID=W7TGC9_9STRA|nr:hypothetical protein Naga_102185g1 [Nannochloropsis gaditana]